MKIEARVENSFGRHIVTLRTNETATEIDIPPRSNGFGSSANGGELLCLALATCWCNDLYREARKRGIEIERVEVQAEAVFGAEGAPAEQVVYRPRVWAKAPREKVLELIQHTDTVAEIQNTLRRPCSVALGDVEIYEA